MVGKDKVFLNKVYPNGCQTKYLKKKFPGLMLHPPITEAMGHTSYI